MMSLPEFMIAQATHHNEERRKLCEMFIRYHSYEPGSIEADILAEVILDDADYVDAIKRIDAYQQRCQEQQTTFTSSPPTEDDSCQLKSVFISPKRTRWECLIRWAKRFFGPAFLVAITKLRDLRSR